MERKLVPQVVIDEASIRQAASGQVTGVIYWQIGDRCFPDESWNDFVVVVLTWWLEGISRIRSGKSERVVLSFMDGPVEVDLRSRGDELVFEFVRRRKERQVEYSAQCDSSEFLTTFIETVGKAAQKFRRLELPNADIEKFMNAQALLTR